MYTITDKIQKDLNGETVTAEICNTPKKFAWRLRIGEFTTAWTSHYSGILTIRSQKTGYLYGYATDYWNTVLPVEQIFQIIA